MTATPEIEIHTEKPQTPEQLLADLAELHLRTLVSPQPKHPAAMGWQATAGSMAAGFARTLHALQQVAPDKAAELTEWFHGEFDEGPDPEEHTEWAERHIAKSPTVWQKWLDDAHDLARQAQEATGEWERKQQAGAVQPISDAFPEGAAIVRLKAALAQFRSTQHGNPLAEDLDAAIRFVEFTRGDIRQLRKAWAAITGCLVKQGALQYLTDADLVDVPVSHRAFLLGRDALRRDLLKVVEERNALRPECSAGLMPLNSDPVERCVVRGKHDTHQTQAGQKWTNADAGIEEMDA